MIYDNRTVARLAKGMPVGFRLAGIGGVGPAGRYRAKDCWSVLLHTGLVSVLCGGTTGIAVVGVAGSGNGHRVGFAVQIAAIGAGRVQAGNRFALGGVPIVLSIDLLANFARWGQRCRGPRKGPALFLFRSAR